MAHRITIPDELGGGWVDIKEKRSWADSNRLAGSALQMRRGLSQADMDAAATGSPSELFELQVHQGIASELEVAILATSPGLMGASETVHAWLDSDDLDEEVGDHLLAEVRGYYAARRRSKSGTSGDQSDAGRDAGADAGAGAATGLRALPDRDEVSGVPA